MKSSENTEMFLPDDSFRADEDFTDIFEYFCFPRHIYIYNGRLVQKEIRISNLRPCQRLIQNRGHEEPVQQEDATASDG